MKTYIEYQTNGTENWADEYSGGFCWSNGRDEESSRPHATLAEAQQDAIDWEAGRRDRYEGSEEEASDARNRHLNQRCDDARGA